MMRYLIVMMFCVSACYCVQDVEEMGRKKHGIHHIYHSGLIYMLTLLVIKAKVILVVGSLFVVALFIGKFFAFFKYAKYFFDKHENHHEEVIYSDPHIHDHSHYSSGPDVVYDAPPAGYSNSNEHYARKIGSTMSDNIGFMKEIFNRMDLSEYAFDSMDVKTNSCKKRFVCEADFHAKENALLALGMYMFSDTGFSKYRNKSSVTSIEDCRKLYPDCISSTNASS